MTYMQMVLKFNDVLFTMERLEKELEFDVNAYSENKIYENDDCKILDISFVILQKAARKVTNETDEDEFYKLVCACKEIQTEIMEGVNYYIDREKRADGKEFCKVVV